MRGEPPSEIDLLAAEAERDDALAKLARVTSWAKQVGQWDEVREVLRDEAES